MKKYYLWETCKEFANKEEVFEGCTVFDTDLVLKEKFDTVEKAKERLEFLDTKITKSNKPFGYTVNEYLIEEMDDEKFTGHVLGISKIKE